jgi:hypothetical protein
MKRKNSILLFGDVCVHSQPSPALAKKMSGMIFFVCPSDPDENKKCFRVVVVTSNFLFFSN